MDIWIWFSVERKQTVGEFLSSLDGSKKYRDKKQATDDGSKTSGNHMVPLSVFSVWSEDILFPSRGFPIWSSVFLVRSGVSWFLLTVFPFPSEAFLLLSEDFLLSTDVCCFRDLIANELKKQALCYFNQRFLLKIRIVNVFFMG